MTQSQRDTVTGWWTQAKEAMTFVIGVIAVLGALYAILQWSSGGVQLQSQIDLKDVKTKLTDIQTDQGKIISRLDQLPRPSDYSDQQAHLSRLDARVDELHDSMTGARHDIDSILHPPVYRNPRQ